MEEELKKRLEGLGCEIKEEGRSTYIRCPTSAINQVIEEMEKPTKLTIKFEGD